MAQGNIVAGTAQKRGGFASVAIRVDEGADGLVEYYVSTPLVKADGSAKSNGELKADLIAECVAQRGAQRAAPQALAVSGAVTV